MSIEDRIARLEARRAIDDLICDLARAIDAGPSADMLRPLFTDEAVFVIDQYGEFKGADAIAAGVAGNADQGFSWTLHYLVSPKVNLSEDIASADIDFMLWETATSASGRAYWIGGKYVAKVRNEKSAWRFSELRLIADLISRYPAGWEDKPVTLASA